MLADSITEHWEEMSEFSVSSRADLIDLKSVRQLVILSEIRSTEK